MTDPKAAWNDVADSMTDLGRQLKVHFDDVVAEKDANRQEIDDALARPRSTLDRAFTAAGHATKDPALREEATKLGTTFVDALSATLTEAGRRLKTHDR